MKYTSPIQTEEYGLAERIIESQKQNRLITREQMEVVQRKTMHIYLQHGKWASQIQVNKQNSFKIQQTAIENNHSKKYHHQDETWLL